MKGLFKFGFIASLSFIAIFIPRVYAADSDKYTVTEEDYTVTIPAELDIDSSDKTQTLSFSGTLLQANELTITVESANKTSDEAADSNYLVNGDDKISYQMNNNKDKITFYHELTSVTSPAVDFNDSITIAIDDNAEPKYAGIYSDRLSFSFSSTSVNYFDLNGDIDGNDRGDIEGIGTADIYIKNADGNWEMVGTCTDLWRRYAYGTEYLVNNIKTTNDNYTYVGAESYTGTITKKWQRVDLPFVTNYTLTLNPHGGSVETSSFKVGRGLNYYSKLSTPTRSGYKFLGWYTAEDGVQGADLITQDNAIMDEYNTTLYAHWQTEDEEEKHSFYLDINSYLLDDQTHHELLSDYGSATVKINGTEQYVDYNLFDDGTEYEVSNVVSNDSSKYEYVGYKIVHHPVRDGEELVIREGELKTGTVSGTLSEYTSIYFVFKTVSSTDTDTAVTSEVTETVTPTPTPEATVSVTPTATPTATASSTDEAQENTGVD